MVKKAVKRGLERQFNVKFDVKLIYTLDSIMYL